MKKKQYITFKEKGVTYMQCKSCNDYVNVSENTTAVTCGTCNAIKIPWPKVAKERVSSGRPSGWHFMNEFVDKEGNVFHKGVEQPKLKGTLPPTKVKKSKKRVKVNKDSKMFAQAKAYKEKQKLKKALNKQKDFLDGKVKN
tara:strand:+ start:174 stop:596 length:423 start_codon:yes stop_codon:yes gene_type:complete